MARVDHWAEDRDQSVKPLRSLLVDEGLLQKRVAELEEENELLRADLRAMAGAHPPTAASLTLQISIQYRTTVTKLYGTARDPHTSRARHHAWWLIRQRLGQSYAVIGRPYR